MLTLLRYLGLKTGEVMTEKTKQELIEAGKTIAPFGIAAGCGLLAWPLFGATIGIISGFGVFWGIAILAGAAEENPVSEDDKFLLNPDRPRGIRIAKNCRCEKCVSERAKL
jgi:hypothetical protein